MQPVLTHDIDESASLHWPDDVEDRSKMVMPGDNVEMMCDIINPLAIDSGQRFNVREGGRTVSSSSNLFYNILRLELLGIPQAFHDTRTSYWEATLTSNSE